jgi:predicted Zn finger-like uncharacterized protein
MIFDCPRCNGENVVPAAEIPPEGKVVICVACQQPFRVLPPEDDDASFEDQPTTGLTYTTDDTGHLEAARLAAQLEPHQDAGEATAIGAVTPFFEGRGLDDLDTRGLPLDELRDPAQRPGAAWALGNLPPDATRPMNPPSNAPHPGAAKASGSVAPVAPSSFPQGFGDEPLEATQLPELPPDTAKGLGRRGRPRPDAVDDRTPPSGVAAALVGAPTASLGPSSIPPAAAASVSAGRVAGSLRDAAVSTTPVAPSPLGGGVVASAPAPASSPWARIPLPVRVGALVFPIALVAALAVRGRGAEAPITLPAEAGTLPALVAVGATPGTSPTPSPQPTRAPKPAGLLGDVPTDDAHAFVRVGEARIRSQRGDAGEVVGRLRAGSRVRVLETSEGQALVLVGGSGPVGFLPEVDLSRRLPISALAETIELTSCAPAGGAPTGDVVGVVKDAAACASIVKSAGEACRQRCDDAPEPELLAGEALSSLRARCHEACDLRATRCAKGCGDGPRGGARPERRSRRSAPLPGY